MTTITETRKILGNGERCHSPHTALGWWDDITDIIDKELQYQTVIISSLNYMLRREILGMSKALSGAITVSDPAVSFAYCFKSSGRAVNKAYDRVRGKKMKFMQ